MAKNEALYFTGTLQQTGQSFTDSDGTNTKDLFAAGTEGANIYALWLSSTAPADATMYLSINDGATDFPIGLITVPTNTATDSVQGASGLLELVPIGLRQDHHGNYFLRLSANYKLRGALGSALGAGETITVLSDGELFS